MSISYDEAVAKYNDYPVYFPQLVHLMDRAKVEFNEDEGVATNAAAIAQHGDKIDALEDSVDLLDVPTAEEIDNMYRSILG